MIYSKILLSFFIILLVSCASASKSKITEATRKGFVSEIDEPSTRGQLARITAVDMDVHWRFAVSPDGKSIVFSARKAGSSDIYQLYRIDMGSPSPIKITTGDLDVWDPSYTADGECIVYRSGGSMWKTRKDGSGAKVHIPGSGFGEDYYPQVSRKDKIVFETYDLLENKFLIWTSGIDGSNLTQYREGNFPMWSPDGRIIAFDYDNDIWLMNEDGTELTQLTSTKDIYEGLPCFSPDGAYIAFVSNEGSVGNKIDDFNIWYMKTDGTSKTKLTELRSWDSWPCWGADGIYFLSGRGKESDNVVRIWRLKMDL